MLLLGKKLFSEEKKKRKFSRETSSSHILSLPYTIFLCYKININMRTVKSICKNHLQHPTHKIICNTLLAKVSATPKSQTKKIHLQHATSHLSKKHAESEKKGQFLIIFFLSFLLISKL